MFEFESSIWRLISVIVVILVIMYAWYPIALSRMLKKGIEEKKAKEQAKIQARKYSLIGVFLYMVFMVSLVGLFI